MMKVAKNKEAVEEEVKAVSAETVASKVLEVFGKPKNLYKIVAKHVFDDKFRVNIWLENGDGVFTTKNLQTSYFVTFVDNKIVKSVPSLPSV